MKVDLVSIVPVDTLEILVNGEVAQAVRVNDPLRASFDGPIEIPLGGWIAARASGPASKYIGDDYAFAQTSPVYVVRGGRRFVKASDVQFLSDTVDAIWARADRARWRSAADRAAFRAAIDRAKAHYAGTGLLSTGFPQQGDRGR